MSKENTKVVLAADAKAVLEEDARKRCEQAAKQVETLCNELNVNIVCVVQIVNGQISQAIQFVSR